jgi:hypothetical protein
LIWKKIGNNDFEGYHNLRDSIKVIAEGLRCSPRFIKASIPKRYTPEGDCSFEIVDDLNGKDCSIFIVLPLSEERVL